MKYEELGKGVVRRREKRSIGLFIDGTGLDRATRRINRKVDLSALVRGVASGLTPVVARYYTLVPNEDDSRQRAFLDAVARAGLTVIVKRLPPKGVSRQVSVDLEMASDIIAFSLGVTEFGQTNQYLPSDHVARQMIADTGLTEGANGEYSSRESRVEQSAAAATSPENRSVVVVCPSRELAYPMSLAREIGVDTTTADFGQFTTGDILKSAAKWIDLSDSETIWRE